MSRSTAIRSRWLNYSMDILLVLMISIWLYAPYKDSVLLPTIIVMAGGGVIYELLFPKIDVTLGKIMFSIPILWVLGYFVGLDGELFYLVVLGFATAIRFAKHYADMDVQQDIPILLSTLISSMIFLFLYSTNDHLIHVLWLTIAQFCFFIFVRINRMMIQQPENKKLHRILIYSVSIFLGLSSLFALFLPVVKTVFFFLLKAVTTVLAFIFYYPLQLFFNWFATIFKPQEAKEQKGEESDGQAPINENSFELTDVEPSDFLLNAAILVGIILLIWYGYKHYKNKLKTMEYSTVSATMDSKYITGDEPEDFWFGFQRNKAPSNSIRKQLFKLERKMGKYNHGRYRFESVSEWLDRVNAPEDLRGEIDRIYKRVRYREEEVPDAEALEYRHSISKLISWSKERYKSTKKDIE